jgi:hypothetical protein
MWGELSYQEPGSLPIRRGVLIPLISTLAEKILGDLKSILARY